MCSVAVLAFVLWGLWSTAGQITLVLKSGASFDLAAPSRLKDGRVNFTTTDGRFLSVGEAEVARETRALPEPPIDRIDTTDPRQLGRFAREYRKEKGINALVAPEELRDPRTEKNAPDAKKTAAKKTTKIQKKDAGVLSDQSP
jgi:hypothetical protein